MTTRLIDIAKSELNLTLRVLSDAGVTTDDFDWIRQRANAGKIAEFLRNARAIDDHNPFALSAEELLKRLRLANKEEGWEIGEEVFDRLTKTVPEQPRGRLAFLSLRIRFGEGEEGVCNTFAAHCGRIRTIFDDPHTPHCEAHLRLLVGNYTHEPVVEWVTIDLGANHEVERVEDVRGELSLADEGLAFAWLHPEYMRAINGNENQGFFLAGYEWNEPRRDRGGPWEYIPVVYWYHHKLRVSESNLGWETRGRSVPVLLE